MVRFSFLNEVHSSSCRPGLNSRPIWMQGGPTLGVQSLYVENTKPVTIFHAQDPISQRPSSVSHPPKAVLGKPAGGRGEGQTLVLCSPCLSSACACPLHACCTSCCSLPPCPSSHWPMSPAACSCPHRLPFTVCCTSAPALGQLAAVAPAPVLPSRSSGSSHLGWGGPGWQEVREGGGRWWGACYRFPSHHQPVVSPVLTWL